MCQPRFDGVEADSRVGGDWVGEEHVVVTDDFVYIHIPKTGGTFVETALRAVVQRRGAPYLDTSTAVGRAELGAGKHGSVVDVPAKHRDKPIVTTVRNPYDHLVSHYEFGWWRTHPGDVFDEESIRIEHPITLRFRFKSTLWRYMTLGCWTRRPPARWKGRSKRLISAAGQSNTFAVWRDNPIKSRHLSLLTLRVRWHKPPTASTVCDVRTSTEIFMSFWSPSGTPPSARGVYFKWRGFIHTGLRGTLRADGRSITGRP